eukprot:7002136-Pyramimonas_sp.AAC.1
MCKPDWACHGIPMLFDGVRSSGRHMSQQRKECQCIALDCTASYCMAVRCQTTYCISLDIVFLPRAAQQRM